MNDNGEGEYTCITFKSVLHVIKYLQEVKVMKTYKSGKITSKGQLTFPAALREKLNVQEGDQLEFVSLENGHFELKVIKKKKLSEIAGMLKSDIDPDITVARQAVDGYFEEIDKKGIKS